MIIRRIDVSALRRIIAAALRVEIGSGKLDRLSNWKPPAPAICPWLNTAMDPDRLAGRGRDVT